MEMTRRQFIGFSTAGIAGLFLNACANRASESSNDVTADRPNDDASTPQSANDLGTFERGSQIDRGFEVDDLLRDTPAGDIHFSLHVPDSYDGSEPYALYVHCPGWEGLYFQGVGANLQEDFAFVANDYVPNMIVASPQLDDWGETSAEKTVVLTRWLLANYSIDSSRVYLSGYSGGGETISLVMDKAPELYRRVLHMSSKWDGEGDALVAARVPLHMSIGESDDYYGSGPVSGSYEELRQKYVDAGLTDSEIGQLLVLDVKPASYFEGFSGGQHAGGAALFSRDPDIMGWLFR